MARRNYENGLSSQFTNANPGFGILETQKNSLKETIKKDTPELQNMHSQTLGTKHLLLFRGWNELVDEVVV